MRIGWISSADPCSKSAYFTGQIRPALAAKFEIRQFAAEAPDLSSAVLQSFAAEECDFLFYVIEDSTGAAEARSSLLSAPGAVFFADFEFLPTEANAEISNRQQARTARIGLPSVTREAASSLLTFAPSLRAVAELKKKQSDQAGESRPVWYLPYPVRVLPRAASPRSGAPAVAFAGSPALEHRSPHVLRALAESESPLRLIWVCNGDERGAAEALCLEFGINAVEFIGPRTPDNWARAVIDASVAVHLWYSAYGDPQPYLGISMLSGVPVIVHRFASGAELPEGAAFFVEPGLDAGGNSEVEQLSAIFNGPLKTPAAECARSYALETHSGDKVIGEFVQCLETHAEELRRSTLKWFSRPELRELIIGGGDARD